MEDKSKISLIESLGGRGEKYPAQNLQSDEKVITKLKGFFGEGFALTDRHVYVIKWGFMVGSTLGGRCSAFDYASLVGIEIRKSFATSIVEVLSAATRDKQLSYWTQTKNADAKKSNYAVTFPTTKFASFQQAVLIARDLINKKHGGTSENNNHDISALEKLAELKDKGIITDEEFAAKKKQVLNL